MKYSKYILWLAAPFLFASCGDDFLNLNSATLL